MNALERLTSCLSRLPGVGRKTAERMAVRLLLDRERLLRDLVAALQDAARDYRCCSMCGSITAASEDPCALCTSPGRDGGLLCVVESPADVLLLERSGGFRGRYHALMGKLSPMRGDGPRDLRVEALLERVAGGGFREVVLALSTDVEGDATAAFLAEQLGRGGVKVTRLAFGLPSGSGVMYSDPLTLARAMRGRVPAADTAARGEGTGM